MTDAEETAGMIAAELAKQGLHEHDLALPIFQAGPAYLVMLGPHNEVDGFCWCQPGIVFHGNCPGHAVHRDLVH